MSQAIKKVIPEESHIAIFEELKEIMLAYNVNDLANVSGIGVSTIYFWLDGTTRKPRLDTICKVAHALGYELRLTKSGKASLKRGRGRLRVVK